MEQAQIYTSPCDSQLALVPLTALLILLACCFYVKRNANRRNDLASALLWLAPQFVSLVALSFLCGARLYVSSGQYLVASVVMVACSGALIAARSGFQKRPHQFSHVALVFFIRDLLLLPFVVCIGFLLIELPWNTNLFAMNELYIALNIGLLTIPFLFLFLFSNRRGGYLAILLVACFVLGWAQYFIGLFKGSAIRPSDILAVGTAFSVSDGYRFEVGAFQVLAVGLLCIAISVLSFMRPLSPCDKGGKRSVGGMLRVTSALALVLLSFVAYRGVDFTDSFGFETSLFDSLSAYRRQGFIASFISLAQNARIVRPEGYNTRDAEALLQSYVVEYDETCGASENRQSAQEQFALERPTIVVIMNEAFSDLSIYDGMGAGYEGPEFVNAMDDALYKGYAYSSVVAGGTCNSEFEFLTGAAMAFIGTENQPYVMHNLSGVSSLPDQLHDVGYTSTAIHPMPGSNWNRDNVYAAMGFDHFLDVDSFDDSAPVRHAGLTDGVTYEKVLEQLQVNDGPQLIFDVTMQNHGAYDTFDLPIEERIDSNITWVDGPFPEQTTEYISLIAASDEELGFFLSELKSVDRPVVVVFFGDHQPAHGPILNEVLFSDENPNDPNHFEREYQVPYFIWANYDVAGISQTSERLDTGINALAAVTLNAIGAPLSDWQKAQIVARLDVPVINGFGYQTSDGQWHSLANRDSWNQAVRDLEWIQYLEYATRI